MSYSATMWLTDAFLISFGQQWDSMAYRKKRYQALDTHNTFSTMYLLLVWVFFMGFVGKKRLSEIL